MQSKSPISIHQFTQAFADVPENYFQKLEGKIMQKTVERAELKTKLAFLLHAKPADFELLKVDENYFEALEQSLIGQTSGAEATQPWLVNKQEIAFDIPDQYFDRLSSRIKERIPVKKQYGEQWEWIPALVKQPVYLLAAAMLCVAIGFGYLQISNQNTTPSFTSYLDSLTKEELASYIATRTEEIDIATLATTSWETELSHHELTETDVNDLILTDEL